MARTGSKDKGKGPGKGKKTTGNQKETSKEPENVLSEDDDSDSDAEELRRKIAEEGGVNVSEVEAGGSGLQQGEKGGNRAEEIEEIEMEGAADSRKKAEAANKRSDRVAKKVADKKAAN